MRTIDPSARPAAVIWFTRAMNGTSYENASEYVESNSANVRTYFQELETPEEIRRFMDETEVQELAGREVGPILSAQDTAEGMDWLRGRVYTDGLVGIDGLLEINAATALESKENSCVTELRASDVEKDTRNEAEVPRVLIPNTLESESHSDDSQFVTPRLK